MSNSTFQSQSLNDWLFYLEQQHPTEIELGLSRVDAVAVKADIKNLGAKKTVLVAGTNGKGTTIRFIEMTLLKLGYRVGVFSSPHLFKYNERVRINGELLDDETHIEAFEFIEQHKEDTSLTYFEFSTLAAFKIFQDSKLDVVLVEVGLGGRLDSTNIIQQDISVITSIGLDHTDWLGNTLEAIAFEKAGIFKKDNLAIIGETNPPKTIKQQADALQVSQTLWSGKEFTFCDAENGENSQEFAAPRWHYNYGNLEFQNLQANFVPKQNIATAITTLIALEVNLNEALLNQVIADFSLPGRMQILNTQPLQFVDVAHNPHAVNYLNETLKANPLFSQRKGTHAVVAMMKDKDIKETLELLIDRVDYWHLGDLQNNKRAASATYIQAILLDLGAKQVSVYESLPKAWLEAEKHQQTEELLLGFGSFYTVCEILKLQ